ncbi:osmotically inducible protein C [Aeromicrobium sp. A1-2]|uniref:OsmC family protein n=1 Tax=Aeromicrobium sp. A1-2 TaxID=2107713 RepID=UPI000E4ACC9C|nr:OsmC family protein [Aeromicrobium sp. A1-2]AXT85050.1 osmotically inducible protein C [Aeromicrobium sp. A1-2]
MTTAAAPLEYKVTARAVHGDVAEVTAAQAVVPIDAGWATPSTGAPGPADLLGSAFAACMLKNLARSGALLGFEYDDAHLEVVLHRQDAPPKFTHIEYALRISTDEPERRVELVHTNLRKFGTVYNTLAAVCEVHGTVTAVRRTQKKT